MEDEQFESKREYIKTIRIELEDLAAILASWRLAALDSSMQSAIKLTDVQLLKDAADLLAEYEGLQD